MAYKRYLRSNLNHTFFFSSYVTTIATIAPIITIPHPIADSDPEDPIVMANPIHNPQTKVVIINNGTLTIVSINQIIIGLVSQKKFHDM